MRVRHAWVLVAALAACSSKRDEPAPSPPSTPVAEPHAGSAEAPDLRFVIDRVEDKQKRTDAAPWHAVGGTATFLAVHVDGDDRATFGLLIEPADGTFADAVLVPTTAEAGARVIEDFAKTFGIPVPPPYGGSGPVPLKLSLAMLGTNVKRTADGFASNGTWTATTMFCKTDPRMASDSVFLDWSLAEKRGELLQKDSDLDADFARCLAYGLRDGEPPKRSPANDPTLDAHGPQLVVGPRVAEKDPGVCTMSADRAVLVDGNSLVAVDLATGATTKLDDSPLALHWCSCDAAGKTCAVVAGDMYGTPSVRVLARGAIAMREPKMKSLVVSVSPDGRWIVASGETGLDAWQPGGTATAHITFADTTEARVFGWKQEGTHTVAQVWREDAISDRVAMHWDLDGAPDKLVASTDELPLASRDAPAGMATSPDGSRRIELGEGTLTVKPLPTGTPRMLAFHPADAGYVEPANFAWIDSRYLAFDAHDWGFLDTDTMKITYVPRDGDEGTTVRVAPGFAHALIRRLDGTHLASIKRP